jgi:hypothetical protein
MAYLELAIQNNIKVNLGDVIYYVNNGTKSSHGDVQKKGDGVIINCYLLDANELENNPDMLGEYNVPRAITTFNKKIEPLLVVFKDEVREQLLVTDPESRGIFTKVQCELINGQPIDIGDQDDLEEVMSMSEGEVKFWDRIGVSPSYMYELAEEGWEEYI